MEDAIRAIEQMTFKEILAELEETVQALEGNQLELEDSIKRYERGVALLKASRERLENAQQKVTTLLGELEVQADDTIDDKLS